MPPVVIDRFRDGWQRQQSLAPGRWRRELLRFQCTVRISGFVEHTELDRALASGFDLIPDFIRGAHRTCQRDGRVWNRDDANAAGDLPVTGCESFAKLAGNP